MKGQATAQAFPYSKPYSKPLSVDASTDSNTRVGGCVHRPMKYDLSCQLSTDWSSSDSCNLKIYRIIHLRKNMLFKNIVQHIFLYIFHWLLRYIFSKFGSVMPWVRDQAIEIEHTWYGTLFLGLTFGPPSY